VKKLAILIMTLAILLSMVSYGNSAELLGYPIVPKQARFYTIILGLIGVSAGMVSMTYFSFWVTDLKKRKAR
jgi:hypothetical protein